MAQIRQSGPDSGLGFQGSPDLAEGNGDVLRRDFQLGRCDGCFELQSRLLLPEEHVSGHCAQSDS